MLVKKVSRLHHYRLFGRMNQGAGLPYFQKQMYRATNGHPATIADVIFITFDDCPVFPNRVFVLKPTHNL